MADKTVYSSEKALELVIKITEDKECEEDCYEVEIVNQALLKAIKLAESGEFIQEPVKKGKVLIRYINNIICNYFDIKPEVFQSRTGKREIVVARQLAHYFAKKLTKLSLAKIGDRIGGLDHNTVRYSVKTVDNLKDTDKEYFRKFKDIRDRITT